MTVQQKAQAVLVGAAGVTALVPATKIRAPGNWQGIAPPYITHFPAAMIPTRTFDGLVAFRQWLSYQVEIYATTFSQAETIYTAVIAALDGKHGKFHFHLGPGSPYRGRNDETNLEFLVADFAVAGHET